MSYSSDVLKRAAFNDEIVNILEQPTAKIKLGIAHGYILSYFKSRVKEIDEKHK
jgi:hypothetical protein